MKQIKISMAMLLALYGTQALATCKGNCGQEDSNVNISSSIHNSVKNSNQQTQGQGQEQFIKNSGNSVATIAEGANANSNNTNVTVQGDNFKAPDIPVATAIGPSMSPSAQCMGVATGGAQTMGFGISLGKSYESKPCNQRELARLFASMGKSEAAMSVLCSMDGAEVVKECKK